MTRQFLASAATAACLLATPAVAQDTAESWLPSLITETPAEGFDLAVKMARMAVKTTQPDVETLHKLRPAYSHDPESLIDASGVVAEYFATIAAANEYWSE